MRGKEKTIRPNWCPHKDCKLLAQSQNLICVGKLQKPELHDKGINTHRLCLDTRETKHGIFDLQINQGDAWNLDRLLKLIIKQENP